ncbi:hypothetical protein PUATCC27989T_03225 [Phytobacter ursingii]|nr:hypothetical protein PUATCC27989T_03225 [Phytobacter ursingii]
MVVYFRAWMAAALYTSSFKLLLCWLPLFTPVTYVGKLLGSLSCRREAF